MKIVKFFFVVVLVFVILLPCSVADSGDYEQKIVNYVALGDSIAKGYGLKDVEKESYVGRIANVLEKRYGAVRLTNFGENGLRSDELLEILTDRSNEQHNVYMEKIKEADLITLSIGSNDLLRYVSTDTDFEEFRKKGDEIFTQACEKFAENIPLIIKAIRDAAPNAQLFVNNIYNPCKDISFNISTDILDHLDELAEVYIRKINAGFYSENVQSVFHNKNDGTYGTQYTLIDVKGAFEKNDEKLINMVFSWGDIDPHPNKEGHKVIADMIIPKISLEK